MVQIWQKIRFSNNLIILTLLVVRAMERERREFNTTLVLEEEREIEGECYGWKVVEKMEVGEES